jgi:SAM-dependent methyltransferase
MRFICNICGSTCEPSEDQVGRDVRSCATCNSTPRIRAIVRVLSTAIFGQPLPLSEFPPRPNLKGVGLSDWGYTATLTERFDYLNTFYDTEPKLDITDPPKEMWGTLDFLISSDVFEHVPPPVQRAFDGAFRLLRPGGLLVLTVPYFGDATPMREHYPSLHRFEIQERNGSHVVVNETADGRREEFAAPRFHGGPGLTLEMRIFSHDALIEHLNDAGFSEITDYFDRGSELDPCWVEPHSFPLVAVRPGRARAL